MLECDAEMMDGRLGARRIDDDVCGSTRVLDAVAEDQRWGKESSDRA